jgi:hypothetical protein
VAEIQTKVIKQSGRNAVSRLLHAKDDKETIVGWKSELNRILHVFNVRSVAFARPSLIVLFQTELIMNIHVNVSDIRDDVSKIREGIGGQVQLVSASCIQSIVNRRCLQVPRLEPG